MPRELPELPTGAATMAVTGLARVVGGRTLVVLPFAAPVGPSRGRRFRVDTDNGAPVTRVVLRLGGRAALRPPDHAALGEGELVPMRLRALPARSRQRVPADLDKALAEAGLGLDGLDESTLRHLLSMVNEAHDPDIRATRIAAAVTATAQAAARLRKEGP